jgi:hypothetical protein
MVVWWDMEVQVVQQHSMIHESRRNIMKRLKFGENIFHYYIIAERWGESYYYPRALKMLGESWHYIGKARERWKRNNGNLIRSQWLMLVEVAQSKSGFTSFTPEPDTQSKHTYVFISFLRLSCPSLAANTNVLKAHTTTEIRIRFKERTRAEKQERYYITSTT